MIKSKSAGLYLHIPFCEHKCGYCDFYSSTNISTFGDQFVKCLIKEIEESNYTDYIYNTIFFLKAEIKSMSTLPVTYL